MLLLPAVESPDVAEANFSQVYSCVPAFKVEQLGLHAPPERFRGSVVVSITDASHEEYESCYFMRRLRAQEMNWLPCSE